MEKSIALVGLIRVTQEETQDNSNDLLSLFNSSSATMANSPQTVKPQFSPPVNDGSATYEETKEELEEAIIGSNDVLANASTVLTLFRDTVILDRAKLTVTRRNFFRSAELMSIRIEDILNVTATVGPFFGNLVITSRVMSSGPYKIGIFYREDALKLKRITQGYVIALQREIDCNQVPTNELVDMLDSLGEDDHHPL